MTAFIQATLARRYSADTACGSARMTLKRLVFLRSLAECGAVDAGAGRASLSRVWSRSMGESSTAFSVLLEPASIMLTRPRIQLVTCTSSLHSRSSWRLSQRMVKQCASMAAWPTGDWKH